MIVARRDDDVDLLPDFLTHHVGDGADFEVVIAGVPCFAVDRLVRLFEQHQIEVGHVLNVQVGAQLLAAEHGDAAIIDGVIGEDVDREIEPQPRRVTAHRGGTQRHRDETRLALFLQDILAHGFVLGIVGERLERQIFGDVGLVLDAVDRGRGRIDEALDAGVLARLHQRPEAIEIDRPAEIGIEVEGRIVGNAGEMNHGVAAGNRFAHIRRIAQIAFDLDELRTVVEAGKNLAVNVQVEDGDLIAGVEQFGYEVRTDVTSPAGYEDTLEPISHHAFRFPCNYAAGALAVFAKPVPQLVPQPMSMSSTAWHSARCATSTKPYSLSWPRT